VLKQSVKALAEASETTENQQLGTVLSLTPSQSPCLATKICRAYTELLISNSQATDAKAF